MKNFRVHLSILAVMAFLFTSCSKEEAVMNEDPNQKASLSFTTVLNDMVANNANLKQQMSIPDCSDDAPAYVAVVLSGEENIGTTDDPLIVSVNPNPGNYDEDDELEYFTDESTELELTPGQYTLEYFVVYNGNPDDEGTEVIWVAPRVDGELAAFVDAPLPQTFNVGAGVKKYVDVEVLCFDDRNVNEYGYLFFDLETTTAIEFCVFGNFCDEDGRHYPAEFSVSVWEWDGNERGDLIHSDLENTVTMNDDNDWAGSTVCMALPDTAGDDAYYFEITLQDSEAYDTETRVIRSGVVTDDEVRDLFDGDDNVDYYHFREGACDTGDMPALF